MKTVFIVLISISIAMSSRAQQHVSIGPTAGFGHNWLYNEAFTADYEKSFHPSYNVGLKMVYSIVNHWGISADLKFSGEGGRFNLKTGDNEFIYRANYIRLPIQGIYFFGEYGQAVRPKISLGPSFGFLVGGKYKQEVNEQSTYEQNINQLFKGFDLGLNVAAGANFRVSPNTWLNTDLTYYHGLSDVSESDNTIRNRGIGVNVGLLFGINAPVVK